MPKWYPEVRIISDGSPWGTHVEVNGKRLTCVTKIEWSVGMDGKPASARLEIDMPMLEVTGELTELELKELVDATQESGK